jgi:hypothetical protein
MKLWPTSGPEPVTQALTDGICCDGAVKRGVRRTICRPMQRSLICLQAQ